MHMTLKNCLPSLISVRASRLTHTPTVGGKERCNEWHSKIIIYVWAWLCLTNFSCVICIEYSVIFALYLNVNLIIVYSWICLASYETFYECIPFWSVYFQLIILSSQELTKMDIANNASNCYNYIFLHGTLLVRLHYLIEVAQQ